MEQHSFRYDSEEIPEGHCKYSKGAKELETAEKALIYGATALLFKFTTQKWISREIYEDLNKKSVILFGMVHQMKNFYKITACEYQQESWEHLQNIL